ncbi:hypothetical protein AHAS_Ahas07G0097400 [Arachis hypogaea]
MTTNISEYMNVVMKATDNLLITTLLKSTYFRLVGAEFSRTLVKAIEFNSKHLNIMNIYQFDYFKTTFTVKELVLLDENKWDYGYFLAKTFHVVMFWRRAHTLDLTGRLMHSSSNSLVMRMTDHRIIVLGGRPIFIKIGNNIDDIKGTIKKKCEPCRRVSPTRRRCTAIDGGALVIRY